MQRIQPQGKKVAVLDIVDHGGALTAPFARLKILRSAAVRIRKRLGALLREAHVHLGSIWGGSDAPGVLFFPSQGPDDGAARLRAYAIADQLRSFGWRTAVCPKHLDLGGRRRVVAVFRPTFIIMQTARHPLNRPNLFSGVPVIIDIDDADYVEEEARATLIAALESSAGVIAGSRSVARFCRKYNKRVSVVWTGTPPTSRQRANHAERSRVVTWAASSPVGSLEERAFVKEVLSRLVSQGVDFEFTVYSDDGSDAYKAFLHDLVPPGLPYRSLPYMDYNRFLQSLDQVAVGLAPLIDMQGFAGGKSFGKVLAYLDRDVSIVTHPVVDHPLFFRDGITAMMPRTAGDWAKVISHLLDNPKARQAISDAAYRDYSERLTTVASARLVDKFLTQLNEQ